ncbi:unnamed protein product [Lactuca saligna]|uniref:Uncharacterized protein n=1 Tax=Lactuca saligna TaxID=75948 RepID=A0AA36E464_LACSI|nr:unnamed protein product [Lactuca saligna]
MDMNKKVFTTQILILIPSKHVQTTTITPNVKVDILKLQSKKGFNVNEIGSRSSIVKFVATLETNVKGKSFHVEPSGEEKKRLQELELENMKQLNNIMRQREKDPPALDKEDLNKLWCYETIETIVIADVDAF